MNYLIAFGSKPRAGFLDILKSAAADEGVDIIAAKVCPGPGCYNLAVRLKEENEIFAKQLTMALMPAKWATFDPAELADGEFIEEIK